MDVITQQLCSKCNRSNCLIIVDQTIQAEGLGQFFKRQGNAAKRKGKIIVNNLGKNRKLLQIQQ